MFKESKRNIKQSKVLRNWFYYFEVKICQKYSIFFLTNQDWKHAVFKKKKNIFDDMLKICKRKDKSTKLWTHLHKTKFFFFSFQKYTHHSQLSRVL